MSGLTGKRTDFLKSARNPLSIRRRNTDGPRLTLRSVPRQAQLNQPSGHREATAERPDSFPTCPGPADVLDTCALFFVQAINSAQERVWITSPYFVPDEMVVAALQLAALRGVEVRIMLPQHPDHRLVYLAGLRGH